MPSFLLPYPGPRVSGLRLRYACLLPAACCLPACLPAACKPKVLHPYGVVVVVAHPPAGLYIRIF